MATSVTSATSASDTGPKVTRRLTEVLTSYTSGHVPRLDGLWIRRDRDEAEIDLPTWTDRLNICGTNVVLGDETCVSLVVRGGRTYLQDGLLVRVTDTLKLYGPWSGLPFRLVYELN